MVGVAVDLRKVLAPNAEGRQPEWQPFTISNYVGHPGGLQWAGETARLHLELTPWYGCNRRPLRFHASTDCLQTEGSLHAPWALYKEDTATPEQEGEDFIELFNAAAEISA